MSAVKLVAAQLAAALKAKPEAWQYLTPEARRIAIKAEPITRAEIERIMASLIGRIDRAFLRTLENDGINVPASFWYDYEAELARDIAKPLRKYIEQSFTNYSDYVTFIDRPGAIGDIDTLMTREINRVAKNIAENSRRYLSELIAQGIAEDEIIERLALRFGSGHAEQIAITETTRAEAQFGEALQSRLKEQGVNSQIRWGTAEDEKVCPICGPADLKLKDEKITGKERYIGRSGNGGWSGQSWGERFPSGPPAHPNCRCITIVELVK